MRINIKQTEIIAAITAYIASQGINLAGKNVTIEFTAGRKEGGLTADIDIEDVAQVPDLGYDDEVVATAAAVIKTAAAPALSVVKTIKPVAEEAAPVVALDTAEEEGPPFDGGTPVETPAKEAAVVPPKAGKTVASAGTSLFS